MKSHSKLRFFLGIIRYPSQAWRRIRELTRIVSAPSLGDKVPSDVLTDIQVIPVGSDPSLQEKLVAMYMDNPSPFVNGPKSTEQLREEKDRGISFFWCGAIRGNMSVLAHLIRARVCYKTQLPITVIGGRATSWRPVLN